MIIKNLDYEMENKLTILARLHVKRKSRGGRALGVKTPH